MVKARLTSSRLLVRREFDFGLPHEVVALQRLNDLLGLSGSQQVVNTFACTGRLFNRLSLLAPQLRFGPGGHLQETLFARGVSVSGRLNSLLRYVLCLRSQLGGLASIFPLSWHLLLNRVFSLN